MIKKSDLFSETRLIKNMDAFELDYIPDQILFREQQLSELCFRVSPGFNGGRPMSTICRGQPGTGKTLSVKYLFSEIERTQKRLVPVYVNCQTHNTTYAVISRIYQQVIGNPPPRSGISRYSLLDCLAFKMRQKKIVILVCLDNVEYLIYNKTINEILHLLLRMYQSHPDCRIGVILVTNVIDLDLSKSLDQSVLSSLSADDIPFPPYAAEEIHKILLKRVNQAVLPGVIPAEVLELVVQKTHEAGDLSIGLDLLKRGVQKAERNGRSSVRKEDILLNYRDARH
ncbi:MAG: cell division control protein 6, partial [Methanocalculus sp. MSAO_Arc2]|uniref:AAA family ATPase n=1 Tax=Methanocalculus sp. MSAO_Arc2 TaxID=2293855 RepID=UPI000FF205D1